MITELSWQLWIILAEVWFSAVVASFIAAKHYQYTWRNIGWALSDLGIIALLIWGGNPSWQHLLFGTLYAWAIFNRLRRTITGNRREIDKEHPNIVAFFMVVISTALTLLVVTG